MALHQTHEIKATQEKKFPELKLEIIGRKTPADLDLKKNLSALGGKGGAFINSLRKMLLEKKVDLIMHSLKDLPSNKEYYNDDRFVIGGYFSRDDPRDVLVLRKDLKYFPEKCVIGTASVRRAAFLKRLFHHEDITVVPYRGSVDNRIQRMDEEKIMKLAYGYQNPVV